MLVGAVVRLGSIVHTVLLRFNIRIGQLEARIADIFHIHADLDIARDQLAGGDVAGHHFVAGIVRNRRQQQRVFGVVDVQIIPIAPVLLARLDGDQLLLVRRTGETAFRPIAGVERDVFNTRNIIGIGAMDTAVQHRAVHLPHQHGRTAVVIQSIIGVIQRHIDNIGVALAINGCWVRHRLFGILFGVPYADIPQASAAGHGNERQRGRVGLIFAGIRHQNGAFANTALVRVDPFAAQRHRARKVQCTAHLVATGGQKHHAAVRQLVDAVLNREGRIHLTGFVRAQLGRVHRIHDGIHRGHPLRRGCHPRRSGGDVGLGRIHQINIGKSHGEAIILIHRINIKVHPVQSGGIKHALGVDVVVRHPLCQIHRHGVATHTQAQRAHRKTDVVFDVAVARFGVARYIGTIHRPQLDKTAAEQLVFVDIVRQRHALFQRQLHRHADRQLV